MAMKVEIEEDDYSMLEKEIKVLIEMRYLYNLPQKENRIPTNQILWIRKKVYLLYYDNAW